MNKTDIIFYLSTLSGLGSLFVKLTTHLISAKVADWIGVVSVLIAFLAFTFYEKLQGTTPPPAEPIPPVLGQ